MNIMTDDYGWMSGEPEESHAYLLPEVFRMLDDEPRGKLIDIGTGNGALLPRWRASGWETSAMEPDLRGFQFAVKKAPWADVRRLALGVELPDDWIGSFDAAVCLEVVEHLYDPRQLPATASLLLKEGGLLVVSTPYHGYLKNLAISLIGKWDSHLDPLRTGGHIKFWSRANLERLFTDQGFVPLSFHGAGRLPFLWKSMVMAFRKGNA